MKKCEDLQIVINVTGSCPYCGSYFDELLDDFDSGDEINCEECGVSFLLIEGLEK